MDFLKIINKLENYAYSAMQTVYDIKLAMSRIQKSEILKNKLQEGSPGQINFLKINEIEKLFIEKSKQFEELQNILNKSIETEKAAINLWEITSIIFNLMKDDILAATGPDHATRLMLYNFCLHELKKYSTNSKPIKKLVTMLTNKRDDALKFAQRIDDKLKFVSEKYCVELPIVRSLYELGKKPSEKNIVNYNLAKSVLGSRFDKVEQAITLISQKTYRSSSIIETTNSRVRTYVSLRKSFGPDSLELLQFYLNHKIITRSFHSERIGKSATELMTGKKHPHWLDMLGYGCLETENIAHA
jgi:hypothetical protein